MTLQYLVERTGTSSLKSGFAVSQAIAGLKLGLLLFAVAHSSALHLIVLHRGKSVATAGFSRHDYEELARAELRGALDACGVGEGVNVTSCDGPYGVGRVPHDPSSSSLTPSLAWSELTLPCASSSPGGDLCLGAASGETGVAASEFAALTAAVRTAVRRCALAHGLYQVLGNGDNAAAAARHLLRQQLVSLPGSPLGQCSTWSLTAFPLGSSAKASKVLAAALLARAPSILEGAFGTSPRSPSPSHAASPLSLHLGQTTINSESGHLHLLLVSSHRPSVDAVARTKDSGGRPLPRPLTGTSAQHLGGCPEEGSAQSASQPATQAPCALLRLLASGASVGPSNVDYVPCSATPAHAKGRPVGGKGSLTRRFFEARKDGPATGCTALGPELAFLMANLARVRPESDVLDPTCGTGSTLLAAALVARVGADDNADGGADGDANGRAKDDDDAGRSHQGVRLFGSDADSRAPSWVAANLLAAQLPTAKSLRVLDVAAYLEGSPSRRNIERDDHSVDCDGDDDTGASTGQLFDAMCCDPPYGLSAATFGGHTEVIRNILAVASERLRGGGRLCLLVPFNVASGSPTDSTSPNDDGEAKHATALSAVASTDFLVSLGLRSVAGPWTQHFRWQGMSRQLVVLERSGQGAPRAGVGSACVASLQGELRRPSTSEAKAWYGGPGSSNRGVFLSRSERRRMRGGL